MCLAIPVRITEIVNNERALASSGGVIREINTALVEDLSVGDYVILHVGYALSRLDQAEAERTLAAMSEGGILEASA
ncbi:MAG: HypC/HybG/HupF family hydrogenase formation chaperone [Halieaceae bacterium]|jgi:hydrogenase expression/formation protein HypC|nr:HypC/HybG/HupF family hydrogenase formation chaperone [Halieaceae bacterium]